MPELGRIVETIMEWSDRGKDFVLATVVGVRGSTYRGLAARQLVAGDGASVGTVSGGCLDNDLHAIAAEVLETRRPRIVEFDLTSDDEAIWGWGIGCNGATRLLVEPREAAVELADRLATVRAAQRPTAVIHDLTAGGAGARWFVTHSTVDGSVTEAVVGQAREALILGSHRLVDLGEGESALIEIVGSPSKLVVCGAGHDAAPVVRYGAELGFEVTVVDDRRQFLTGERFPEATALVHAEPGDLAAAVELDERSYVVLMSHNYLRDLEYLRSALGSDAAYIGALGPGERLERLIGDLRASGDESVPEDLSRLRGPAGLDIGAEGPREIAWAILAEVLAVRRAKQGGSLTARKGPAELRTNAVHPAAG